MDGTKSVTLLAGLTTAAIPIDDVTFVPVDISRGAMPRLYDTLDGKPGLAGAVPVYGYIADYFHALDARRDVDWVPSGKPRTRGGGENGTGSLPPHHVLAFLGSTVGNNLGGDVPRFLSTLRFRLEPGDALILGTDTLAASPKTHLTDYPPEGLLTDLFLNTVRERMRRELAATRDTVVQVGRGKGVVNGESRSGAPPKGFALVEGDRIRVLITRKFAAKTVAEGDAAAGFQVVGTWTDSKGRFADTVMRAV